jgi:hypothetical protein
VKWLKCVIPSSQGGEDWEDWSSSSALVKSEWDPISTKKLVKHQEQRDSCTEKCKLDKYTLFRLSKIFSPVYYSFFLDFRL